MSASLHTGSNNSWCTVVDGVRLRVGLKRHQQRSTSRIQPYISYTRMMIIFILRGVERSQTCLTAGSHRGLWDCDYSAHRKHFLPLESRVFQLLSRVFILNELLY